MLLGLLNPLAALIPFIDTGDQGKGEAQGCRELIAKFNAASQAPAAAAGVPAQAKSGDKTDSRPVARRVDGKPTAMPLARP